MNALRGVALGASFLLALSVCAAAPAAAQVAAGSTQTASPQTMAPTPSYNPRLIDAANEQQAAPPMFGPVLAPVATLPVESALPPQLAPGESILGTISMARTVDGRVVEAPAQRPSASSSTAGAATVGAATVGTSTADASTGERQSEGPSDPPASAAAATQSALASDPGASPSPDAPRSSPSAEIDAQVDAQGGAPDRAQDSGNASATAFAPPPVRPERRLGRAATSPDRPASAVSLGAAEGAIDIPANARWSPLRDAKRESSAKGKAATGTAGFVLIDLARDRVVERLNADDAFIPASVAKVPTALYALETLGAKFRFATEILADGDIRGGVLKGDLYLAGSGDPTLDTADMAGLARQLAASGVRRVDGRFIYVSGPAHSTQVIDPSQPLYAAYNPSMGGLNLNFNRVLFKWSRRKDGGYDLETTAHAAGRSITASTVRAELQSSATKRRPFQHRFDRQGWEVWGIAKSVLGRRGSRWLPVRRPALYAASVFRALAADAGVSMPMPQEGARFAPQAAPRTLARHESAPLDQMIRDMLRFSTNLTAEVLGLAASSGRGLDNAQFETSTALLSDWLAARYAVDVNGHGGARGAGVIDGPSTVLLNHSGLATASRVTPRQLGGLLARVGDDRQSFNAFFGLLPKYRVRGVKNAEIKAKTGTIYFGRGLAGYINCKRGGTYAFAIFGSDVRRREAYDRTYDPATTDKPKGGDVWLNRARRYERAKLGEWSKRYCG